MSDINDRSRRKFLANMAKAGVMLPFAGSLLGQNAFAAGAGYKNVLFLYHPNGLHLEHWAPSFTGPISTNNELSFGLGELKAYHQNMIVLKNIYIDVEGGGGGDGGGHTNSQLGCMTGDHNNESTPSIDHLIAEKLGNKGVLSLGVRTGSSSQTIVSKPRNVSNSQRPAPNNNPADVAAKLSARVKPVPGNPLQTKIYAAAVADMDALPKAQLAADRQDKITQHQAALARLKSNQAEGTAQFPFNSSVVESLGLNDSLDSIAGQKSTLIAQFPDLCKAQIDNAVAAFANGLYNVATLQLSSGNENGGRVMYSFDECWNMTTLARDRNAGNYFVQRPANLDDHRFDSHGPSHSLSSCSFQAQVRWHFSLVGYALDRLKALGILDSTLVVTISDEGNYDHDLSKSGIVVAGGTGGGLQMGRVIDCGGSAGNGTHKLFGDIARLVGASTTEGPWKQGLI